jgi:hypothetical protein
MGNEMTFNIKALATLCATVTLDLTTPAIAAAPAWAVAPAWSQSSDSDGLTIRKAFAAALPSYTNGLKWQGVEWQEQRYQQNGNSLSGHGVNYSAQDLDALTGMGYSLKVGINQGPEKTTAIGEWNYNRAYNAQLHWGVFASRDWVESMNALQQGIHYDLVGGYVDYQVHPRVTVVGSLAQTHFSDGQDRQQQRARAVWDAWPDQGITLQWAYKHQLGDLNGAATGNYFNPDRLNESMGLIGWRRRYEGWQWYARLGEGRQTVNNDGSTPARLAELQLTSPVRGSSYFKLRAGRSETVGIYSGNTGYVYRYLDAQWIWPLGR